MEFEIYVMFFTAPVLSAVLSAVFILLYLANKNKNKLSEEKLRSYKKLARSFGITTLVFTLLGAALYGLMLLAVAHM